MSRGLPRIKELHGPTTTFAYVVVSTAGLTIDARARASRHRSWEEAFAQLQEALNRDTQGTVLERETEYARKEEKVTTVNEVDVANRERETEASGLGAQHVSQDAHFELPTNAINVEWPANTGPDLVRRNLPPQSLWATDDSRVSSMRKRYTWKKLAIQEFSVGLLVHDLIRQVDLAQFVDSPGSDDLTKQLPHLFSIATASEAKSAAMREEMLLCLDRFQGMPVTSTPDNVARAKAYASDPIIPQYYEDPDGDYHGICQQMNNGIKKMLQSLTPDMNTRDKGKAFVVAKICHNLLVSTASPNLQTFNALLDGFKQLRMTKLVDSVIACMLSCKIRLNETACRFVLQHYTAQSRPDHFAFFVARMRGVKGGLMLANPNVTINDASQGRLVQDEVWPEKVYQKVYPTPMVMSALIGGVMKFAGFDRALDIYYELKRDGWGLSLPDLIKLLAECVRQADWEGGIYVWEEIRSVAPRARSRDMAKAYHTMLSLCSITGNTVAFNQILNEVVKRGHDRRAIITEAMKTTKWAQHRKSYAVPAFTADNLMIAVSDFVTDVKSSDDASEQSFEDDEVFDNDVSSQQDLPTPDERVTPATKDPKEVWSAWVEHEFGERPKDPEM